MARTRTIRTETIVLRHQVFGEADRLLTLLTPNHGKVRAIAKGVRRPSSRKTGHLDLYMRSDVLLATGRNLGRGPAGVRGAVVLVPGNGVIITRS